MIPNRHRFSWYMLFATVLCSVCAATAQQEPPATFVIKISLPESTIHVGDGLAISVIESNPTDHAVKVGEGFNGGIEVEAPIVSEPLSLTLVHCGWHLVQAVSGLLCGRSSQTQNI